MTGPGAGREPRAVGDSLRDVARALGLPSPEATARLAEHWVDIVGPALADHARVVSLSDDTVVIAADAAVWATQLRYLEADVLREVAASVPGVRPTRVRVVVRPSGTRRGTR